MAYQTLYRRYRPRRFAEVRGQAHVVAALRNAVQEGRVGHAYLFSGPRGTGKTTTARILAKVLNCAAPVDGEPCLECDSCRAVEAGTSLDVHELDAASNRGIDDIRRLIESAAMVSGGRTKLYILDEVHMLTEPAENALLKTLEEPPEHVVFVLATTDPQKVRPTIRSRTQHLEFHLLSAADLEEYTRWVVADAGLDVDEAAVAHVVRAGDGSARDTLSALEQVVAAGGVAERGVDVDDVVEALLQRDPGRALASVAEATAAGRDPRVLGERLVHRLRDVFLVAMKAPADHLSDAERDRAVELADRIERPFLTRCLEVVGEALTKMPEAADRRILLETALVRLADAEADTSTAALLERIERLERALAGEAPLPKTVEPAAARSAGGGGPASARAALAARRPAESPVPEPDLALSPPPSPEPVPARMPPPAAAGAPVASGLPTRDELTLAWGDRILGALPRMAKARFAGGRFVSVDDRGAVYALPNEAHRSRCDDLKADVEAALEKHFGRAVPLVLVVDDGATASAEPPQAAPPADEPPADELESVDVRELEDAPADDRSPVDKIAELFPGAELVEGDG